MGRALRVRVATPPEAAEMPDPELRLPEGADPIDLARVFGREGPVEAEIGFGKGRFLIHSSQSRPETSFLGIERSGSCVRLARYRIYRRRLGNVKLVCADALELLSRRLPEASLEAVYVLFPDPWPKKRHHKRRLVTPEFARAVTRVLMPGGRLHVATDHAGYAEVIEAVLAATPGLGAERDGFPLDLAELTNYGHKYAREGRGFRTWTCVAGQPGG